MAHCKLLVVLYKIKPFHSPSLLSILGAHDKGIVSNVRELVIWDNSPYFQGEEVNLIKNKLRFPVLYRHTPENLSLSVIYNMVAKEIKDEEYLVLLDQDTLLPGEYFQELGTLQERGYPLILPRVYCNGKLVSPGKRFFCKGRLLKDISPGVISSKNLLAINSGMAIRGNVFKVVLYDERLRFYGVDTYFMRQYEKFFKEAFVMASKVKHSLSEYDPAISADRKREIAQEQREARQLVFSEGFVERLVLRIYESIVSLRY